MSIHHLEAAAELELHATTKLVLMALADDANKITRITFPGMEKLQQWSGAKPRRVQGIINELIDQELLQRLKSGQPGRKAEFRIFPTAEELAAASTTGDETDTDEPVDNSDHVGAMGCTHENDNGCNPETNGCNPECTPPVRPPLKETVKPSSNATRVTGAVDNSKTDDEKSSSITTPSPATVRVAAPSQLDTAAVAASVGHLLAETGIDDSGIRVLSYMILGKASATVMNKTRYVIQAIRRDQHEWTAMAHQIAAGAQGGRA